LLVLFKYPPIIVVTNQFGMGTHAQCEHIFEWLKWKVTGFPVLLVTFSASEKENQKKI